jgi:signal transduction histidine kinase
MEPPAATEFMPAERADDAELRRQARVVRGSPMVSTLLDAAMGFALVLNRHRQIVHVNETFERYLAESGGGLRVGMRPGEAVRCVNAGRTEGGCGTTEACRHCGAGQSMAASLRGHVGLRECRIRTVQSGEDLDLLVRTTPVELDGEPFVILAAIDISAEKRRLALERIFFHDVTNTAGGIKGLTGMMVKSPPEVALKRYAPLVAAASESLLDEIASHRDLVAAEHGRLALHPTSFPAHGLLVELVELCGHHVVALGRTVRIAADSEDVPLLQDRALVSRVLVNLLKNALEAEPRGGVVTVRCRHRPDTVCFDVHNATLIPRDVQLQLFQRSFSTKGEGRGLGTYSIRLLTERYLHGTVGFTSTPEGGTRFEVQFPIDGSGA